VAVVGLLLITACSAPQSERKQVALPEAEPIAKRVDAIKAETKRIDAATEAPQTADLRRLNKELTHWEFSGTFESSKPIFLSARFTEGQVVREEAYYLLHDKLILARTVKWWDVEDASRAPEPKTEQEFYINNDQRIRRVINVGSPAPVSRTDDAGQPANTLVERSRVITQILLGNVQAAEAAHSLKDFPEAEIPQP
jgi:hypothetical protein